jgi:hypothetical protein
VQIEIVDVRLHQYVLGASRKRRWEADMHLDTAAPDAV